MLGYAIAALKKSNKIVGLRIINTETMQFKDLPLNSCLLLFKKSNEAIKNLNSLDIESIQELSIMDIDKGSLDKEIYTVLFKGLGEQYLICNPKGETYKVDGLEARKLNYNNADNDMEPLLGGYILGDTTDENYDRLMMLDMVSINVSDGVATVIKEADEIIFPSFVTSLSDDCWRLSSEISNIVLSPNMVILKQGDFDGLKAKQLVIPYGVKKIEPFCFVGSRIEKIVILGNTQIERGAFLNSDIKEVYVSKGIKNTAMVATTGTRTKVKDLNLSKL